MKRRRAHWAGLSGRSRAGWLVAASGCGRDWPAWDSPPRLRSWGSLWRPIRAGPPFRQCWLTRRSKPARWIAAGRAFPGATAAVTLARGVLRTMAMARLGGAILLLVAVAILTVAGMIHVIPGSEPTVVLHPVLAAVPAAEAPPAAPARTLDLRVIARETRQPVPNAVVFLDGKGSPRQVTDAEGHCTIALPKDIATRDDFNIMVWREGFSPLSIGCTGYDVIDETFTTYTAQLDPATVMGGIVQDEQGHPIGGAKIRIWMRYSWSQLLNPAGYHGLRDSGDIGVSDPIITDATGRWQLRMLPVSSTDKDHLSIRVTHPDYVSDVTEPRPTPALEDLRNQSAILVMSKGLPARGTVVDPAGNPVAGAAVSLAWSPTNEYERYTTKTDAHGRFAFEHARPRQQSLCVLSDRFAPVLEEINVGPDSKPISIHVQPGRLLRGRVVNSQNQPVEGAKLVVAEWRRSELLDWEVRTDAQGRFEWKHAPKDPFTVSVFWQVGQTSIPAGSAPVEVEIRVKSELRIEGTVVDATTELPVRRVRVIRGLSGDHPPIGHPRNSDARERPQWQYEDTPSFDDGRFMVDFSRYERTRSSALFARVEAEGYIPTISRSYRNDDGRQTWNVRLQPAPGVSGIVRLADGEPVAEATVILVTPKEEATVHNGHVDPAKTHADRRRTAADGRFWFARPDEPFLIAVLSDRGFAVRTPEEMAAGPNVRLQPWGRIEGTLRVGSQPRADEEVTSRVTFARSDEAYLIFRYDVKTDDQSRFVMDRVLPGGLTLSRRVASPEGMLPDSHLAYLEIRPGETISMTLGSTGRPLVGRLVLPPDTGPLAGFANGSCMLIRNLPPPYPKEILGGDLVRFHTWWGRFRQTEAGRAYWRKSRVYAALVDADGNFRIENVEPGSYELRFGVPHIRMGEAGRVWDTLSGQGQRHVDVPEIPGGRTEEPLDLGRIELRITTNHTLKVGALAPPFAVKTFDGKALRLLDDRGKFVLLAFWASWSADCQTEMLHLKDIHAAYGTDPRLSLIGLCLDERADAARQYVASRGLKWRRGICTAVRSPRITAWRGFRRSCSSAPKAR